MKRLADLGLAFALLFGTCASTLAAPPHIVDIDYQLAYNGLPIAKVNQRLEHDGRRYRLTEQWNGKGAFALRGNATRISHGAVKRDGLRPQHFEDKRTGRHARQVEFNLSTKLPTLQQQDQLSLAWTFAFAPPGKPVRVRVADGERETQYTYQPDGRERVKTPAGEFNALKIVKKRSKSDDKVTELWLAVDHQNLPVRILVVDKNGAQYDQVATRIAVK